MLENKIIKLHIVFGCTCDFDEDQILFYDQLMQKKTTTKTTNLNRVHILCPATVLSQ